MNDMWEALELCQPYADKHGFGAAWLKMTTERTEEAAVAAAAGVLAADAEWDVAWPAAAWASRVAVAIKNINEAIKLENKT